MFASHNDYDDNENTNLQEDIPAGIDDTDDNGRSETSSIAYVARKARLTREAKRTLFRDTSVDSSHSHSTPAKRHKIAHLSTEGTPHSPSTKSLSHSFIAAAAAHHQEIDSQALLQLLCKSKNFVKEKDKPDTFAIRPRREGHTMSLTTLPASETRLACSSNLIRTDYILLCSFWM